MSRINHLAVLISWSAIGLGCATNTSPTHVTVNHSPERTEPPGSAEALDSDEAHDVRTALQILREELLDVRRKVAALEAHESPGEAVEECEQVTARPAARDTSVARASFDEAVDGDAPSARPRRFADGGDEGLIWEQSLIAHRSALAIIAHNLANANSIAFKAQRANFEEAYAGARGRGSRTSGVQTDFRQGAFQQTGRPLDVAIEGEGFFQVQDSTGTTLYTRAGNFSLSANSQIVMGSAAAGRLLEPCITLPNDSTDVVIEPGGRVLVRQAGNPRLQQVGQIELALFTNLEGLVRKGENLYAASDASNTPTKVNPGKNGGGALRQSMLEASNVDSAQESANWKMLTAQIRRLQEILDTSEPIR